MSTPPLVRPALTPWPRLVALAIGVVVVLSVLVLAFLWPTVTSSVKNLPIGVVGPAAATAGFEKALADKSPGTFAFTEFADRDAAVAGIETRAVYGAIVLGPSPEVLDSSAANPTVAQLLSGLAPVLQGQLAAAAASASHSAAGAANAATAGGPAITVPVTDVVPLASTDSRGAALGSLSFPLVLGGMIGGIAISIVIVGVGRRLTAVAVYAVIGGLALAAILQGLFGALQGDYWLNAAALGLGLLSISGVIVGFVSLLGRPGIAVGPIVYLLIANPISAAAQPLQFLASPWGAVGQWFPPGASATLLRDLSYFPKADVSFPWLVLGAWALGGIVIAIAGHFRNQPDVVEFVPQS